MRVADHDQRALVRADDVVDRLAERRARRDRLDRREQLRVAPGVVLGRRPREAELAGLSRSGFWLLPFGTFGIESCLDRLPQRFRLL